MTSSAFRSCELDARHEVRAFDSGRPDLDQWLQKFAIHATSNRTARTFVWLDEQPRVVAYYSLAAHVVARDEVPPRLGRGSPARIPAILIARLALDRSLHGRGLGAQVLIDALERVVDASERVGARLVVVDAIDDEAAGSYEHFGFSRVPTVRSGQPLVERTTERRLVRKVSDVAVSIRG